MEEKLKMEISIRTLRNMLYAAWFCGFTFAGTKSLATHPEAVAERRRLGELLFEPMTYTTFLAEEDALLTHKKCTKCGVTQPIESFYRRTDRPKGYFSYCKSCLVVITRLYRRKSYDPVKQKEKSEARKNRGGYMASFLQQKEKFPEKIKARRMARDAVHRGQILKLPCEVCQNPKTDGHHDDYSKPLEVRWMCRTHHMLIHRKSDALLTNNQ